MEQYSQMEHYETLIAVIQIVKWDNINIQMERYKQSIGTIQNVK